MGRLLVSRDLDGLGVDAVNFTNLVSFYREELERIRDGARATTILSDKDIDLLRRRGILTYENRGAGAMHEVHWSACTLMNRLKIRA